jgi:hypothetical protein
MSDDLGESIGGVATLVAEVHRVFDELVHSTRTTSDTRLRGHARGGPGCHRGRTWRCCPTQIGQGTVGSLRGQRGNPHRIGSVQFDLACKSVSGDLPNRI